MKSRQVVVNPHAWRSESNELSKSTIRARDGAEVGVRRRGAIVTTRCEISEIETRDDLAALTASGQLLLGSSTTPDGVEGSRGRFGVERGVCYSSRWRRRWCWGSYCEPSRQMA